MKLTKIFAISLLLVFCVSLAFAQTGKIVPKKVTLKVKAGREFRIALESNQTTGYRWSQSLSIDDPKIRFVRSAYVVPKGARLGQGGKEVFLFKAIKPGKSLIILTYSRPWESDQKPIKQINYWVVITKK